MFFIPFKVDLNINRFPIFTILVSVLCIIIYLLQVSSMDNARIKIGTFCDTQNERSFNIAIEKIYGDKSKEGCVQVFMAILRSNDREADINHMVKEADDFKSFSKEYGKQFLRDQLDTKLVAFDRLKLSDLTSDLEYRPKSFNVINMITAAFAHGDWMHLIGNLFFFFAFAASVEMLLGSLKFFSLILILAMGTHISYSISVIGMAEPLPTIGLSGVVMGMIGIFAYLMPRIKILCFVWFIFFYKVIRVPAWILAAWYIGWDVHDLFDANNSSNINIVAHVSGAVIGFILSVIFLKQRKAEIHVEMAKFNNKNNLRKAFRH